MESSFKLGSTTQSQQQQNQNAFNNSTSTSNTFSQSQSGKNSGKTSNPLFSMDTLTETATSFRIRNTASGSKQQQSRVPTVYGMPKLKTKTLPKLDSQLAQMMINEQSVQQNQDVLNPLESTLQSQMKAFQGTIKPIRLKKDSNNNIITTPSVQNSQEILGSGTNSLINDQNLSKLPSQVKPSSRKMSKQLEVNNTTQNDNKSSSQEQVQIKESNDLKEEIKESQMGLQHNKSRLSTAKSTMSNVTEKSLANVSSESSLIIDPNMIIDENSVLAQLVKQNVQLLQKCLVSQNKAIFIAAIENLKNASNNFGPALNKHLPLVLQLVKKKQDLAAKERIHELKQILIQNGGEEADAIVNKMGLK